MSLQTLFAPKSIAFIGASTTPGSVGNDIAKNLIHSNYAGQIFLVNPNTQNLFEHRCYASIKEISEIIDLALIVVPAPIVPTVLREAGEKMVRAAVIISSGFKEIGGSGSQLEEEIKKIATEHQITLLGPNCLGFIVPHLFLNASFASAVPRPGNIAFFSQSGALLSALLDQAKERLGFSVFASIGNKTLIDENILLSHFTQDSSTRVIGLYTEGITNAPDFIAHSRLLLTQSSKPIIALKSGRTKAGATASSSHTGAMAGGKEAYQTLFRQARIIEAQTFSELLDLLDCASKNPLPNGDRLAIVTNAGGMGVLATDAAVENGLQLATLSAETITKLKEILPSAASIKNPVDILGDARADRYAAALELVATDPGVDLLLIILTPQTMTEPKETAEVIVRLKKDHPDLPLAAVFAGHDLVAPGSKTLIDADVSVISFPEAAALSLGGLAKLGKWSRLPVAAPLSTNANCKQDKVASLLVAARDKKQERLNERESAEVLSNYGFSFPQSLFATTPEEALEKAKSIGQPVALKIVSPDIIHKSDAGGVLLNVSPTDADHAFLSLLEKVKEQKPDARIEGVQVAEMAPTGGLELLVGLKKEPGLGTLVVLGLGGIYVETLRDIAMRFVPLTNEDIDEMIKELRSSPLLLGARGKKGINIEKLKEYIAQLNQLAIDFPEIVELDLNPLLAFPEADRFRVLDARITLKK